MLHMIQGRIKAIQESLKEVPELDPAIFKRLDLQPHPLTALYLSE